MSGDNRPSKVLGKGKANLGDKKTKAVDVLLVEGLKHNIISVRKMVDGGNEIIFNSKGCFI